MQVGNYIQLGRNKMKKSKRLLAVFSFNGVGIYTNQEKLHRDKSFIGKAESKSFIDYEEAVEYAIAQYNSKYAALSEISRTCYLDTLRPNWWYYSKDF